MNCEYCGTWTDKPKCSQCGAPVEGFERVKMQARLPVWGLTSATATCQLPDASLLGFYRGGPIYGSLPLVGATGTSYY